MARRGRKPKSVKTKEFLINNDKDFNSRGGKKGMIFSSAAKFMNIMPTDKTHTYMTPVKKGERLGKGKYRIVAHYPNKKSDDRDDYESQRQSKDLVFDNNLTKPSRIKYDGIVGTGGYHLITHDRDGKRVEFILGNWAGFKNTHGDVGFPIYAEMYLPDKERKRTTGKKLMACPVKVGTFIVSNSHPGEMKLEATKPKGECAKFGNSNAKKHQVSPLEYEKAAETEEHFMSEGELLHFYSMNGVTMDAEDLLSDYQAIDSVIVDRSSYQPAQDYGAENQDTVFNSDTLDEFCASCGEHKAEGCGGCHAAEDSATYEPSSNPDMVNEIQTEPTNANPELFGSQGYDDKMDESLGERDGGESAQSYNDRRDEASAMDKRHSRMGRKYDDVETMDSQNTEGDAANYEPSSEPDMINAIATEPTNAEADLFGAESKNKWVKGKNGKTYVLRKKTGHMVTHNAESPGGAYPTLEDFNGLESVVVEPPLGHGVAQWYAEGDSATYSPSNEPDMVNEIQTEPTNANFEGENFDEVRTGFNYGIGGYLGFTSIALGSLLLMELIGRKLGE